jgi:hypothetical protein
MNNTSVVTLAFAVASAVLATTSQKAEAFIFSFSGDWEFNATSSQGGNQIFYGVKNKSSQKAFDFHIEYSDNALRSRGDKKVAHYDFPDGIESGGTVQQISIQTVTSPGADGNFDAYWTDKNHNRIPEPLTIFG